MYPREIFVSVTDRLCHRRGFMPCVDRGRLCGVGVFFRSHGCGRLDHRRITRWLGRHRGDPHSIWNQARRSPGGSFGPLEIPQSLVSRSSEITRQCAELRPGPSPALTARVQDKKVILDIERRVILAQGGGERVRPRG
jgi:hypothetical protein